MSLPHVLLGMLSTPATGYDLRQQFEQSIRHFWSAELSQIYPTLAKLERDGLLEGHRERSDRGPMRKVYTRTPEGRDALVAWLLQGPMVRSERMPYLTQAFFLDEASLAGAIAFYEQLRNDFDAQVRELEAVERHWREQDPRYPDELPLDEMVKQMVLELGLRKYALIRDWCQDCLDRLAVRRAENKE